MRILFLSHYFPPEGNAPASRTYEHCVRWVRAGHEVTVVTCVPNVPDGKVYPGYKNRLRRQVENVDGIRVVRVWTYVTANAGTIRRIANYLSYMFAAVWTALLSRRHDVVVATSPQFFCGWAGILVSKLKRVPFVLEIRDIWPESITAVGAMNSRRLVRVLEFLERRMYRAADHIVTVGDGYRKNIEAKLAAQKGSGTDCAKHPEDRSGNRFLTPFVPSKGALHNWFLTPFPTLPAISVITNGVDLRFFAPAGPDERFLHKWNLEGKFVCSYIGTIGMAHGLEVVVEAAKLLRRKGRDNIVFCLVGDGASRAELQQRVVSAELDDLVIFPGRQPKDAIPDILASSNACLIHLKKCDLFRTVIPSKMFETMAMRRPIIMGVRGEASAIVMRAHAAVDMEPGCADALVAAVEMLADNPELADKLGVQGREYVQQYYDREVLAERYLEVLNKVAGKEHRAEGEERRAEGSLNAESEEQRAEGQEVEKIAR